MVGGLKPEGTSTDLAVALAIYSTYKGISAGHRILAIGEIGLTGDLRSVQNGDKIVREAARMGFSEVILPQKNKEKLEDLAGEMKLLGVTSLKDVYKRQACPRCGPVLPP